MSKWIDVKEKLPANEKNVLVCCETTSLTGSKIQYICEAYHINKRSIEWDPRWDENIDSDYDEENDVDYVPEGWYEVIHNWGEFSSIVIQDTVTHWMLMPKPPKGE